MPEWLVDAVRAQWHMDMADRSVGEVILVRDAGPYEFSRATWELNLGCDYDCIMCYLGEKRFEGLDMAGKRKLLAVMRDAGVIWLQMTGGEPLIDPDFPEAYQHAYELGMIVEILSNGSRLHKDHVLRLLVANPVQPQPTHTDEDRYVRENGDQAGRHEHATAPSASNGPASG
ncbi:radical SAM protein [Streptomyces coerulescens]|uniref:Radical SAM protein n=1 Tax=Streptomyces coerulescens TaxID=29304 RepID=A0ABW0CSZ9_STRCD